MQYSNSLGIIFPKGCFERLSVISQSFYKGNVISSMFWDFHDDLQVDAYEMLVLW